MTQRSPNVSLPGTLPKPLRVCTLILISAWAGACSGTQDGGAMDGELIAGADMPLGPLTEAGRFLSEGQFRFALEFHQELARSTPLENVVHSPWGTWKSLAILRAMGGESPTEGSGEGSVALGLVPYLNGNTPGGSSSGPLGSKAFEGAYSELQDRVDHSGEHRGSLLDAARLFLGAGLQIREQPALELGSIFGLDVKSVDFAGDPIGAAKEVAAWTGEAASVGSEPAERTAMLLVSKIDFSADWAVRFDPTLTADRAFTRLDGSDVTVPMMAYGEAPKVRASRIGEKGQPSEATLVRLPYAGGAFEMVVVVPIQKDGLPAVEAWLTPERFLAGLHAVSPRKTPFFMPKLEWTGTRELRGALESLGIKRPFEAAGLDVSRLDTGGPVGQQLTSVLQSVRLLVDEAGTKSKVITKSNTILASIEMPVIADRPYLFMVREGTGGAVVLMGRIVDPTGSSAGVSAGQAR